MGFWFDSSSNLTVWLFHFIQIFYGYTSLNINFLTVGLVKFASSLFYFAKTCTLSADSKLPIGENVGV